MSIQFSILPTALLEAYNKEISPDVSQRFENLKESPLTTADFSFYTSVSAVFSSKIEGEEIELDSFIKHKRFGTQYQPDYTQKIDDLYKAYQFAASNKLTYKNILTAHKLLTEHILKPAQQGKLRSSNMFVITDDGRIEYVAAVPEKAQPEIEKLFADLDILLETSLDFNEVLFFASLLHLIFVKIHPFEDGNGRSARLLEKWFIAQKMGEKAWFIQSEKNYYNHHQVYYNNIRKLGLEYDMLDYNTAMPFLLMLSNSIG